MNRKKCLIALNYRLFALFFKVFKNVLFALYFPAYLHYFSFLIALYLVPFFIPNRTIFSAIKETKLELTDYASKMFLNGTKIAAILTFSHQIMMKLPPLF